MATINVSDTITTSENVVVWTFQRNLSETITTAEFTNAQIDLGFLHCYFNNDNLNDIPNLQINAIELYDQAQRNLQSYPLARGDGLKLVNAQYGLKTIVVNGFIAAASRSLFETARDTLLKIVEPQESLLSFSQAGATRQYTCTLANVIWNEKPGGGFATFSLQFACSDPYGYDASATIDLNAVTITASPSPQTFTAIGGTFKALPTFTITLNSGTGLTTQPISVTDQSGNVITISRTWVATDVLSINCATKAITVNGVAIDYAGVFPMLLTGNTWIQYSDGFTTRNVTLTMTHTNRFK